MREFQPDYTNMVQAARNIEVKRFPLYEHKVDPKVMEEITGVTFADLYNGDDRDMDEFFRNYCGFFRDMGSTPSPSRRSSAPPFQASAPCASP